MTIAEMKDLVVAFVQANEAWAAPIVFGLAFGESLAFVSLFFPATVILFALGGLIGASGIDFWSLAVAAALGAALGDAVSYWIGRHFKWRVARFWPLSRYPDLLPTGEAFFRKWGIGAVFFGRFFGPLRAAVPLIAGITAMPQVPFQLANVGSAIIWAVGILSPGTVLARLFH